jgi:hypothetical protein
MAARRLVERWEGYDAGLLTCDDLSSAGWQYHLSNRAAGTAVIDGRKVHVDEIRGVVTLLPWVAEHEVVSIVPADRAYAAAEMSAFLTAWLSDLACPVLNRPTPGSLVGPSWRREQWKSAARQVGMRVSARQRHLRLGPQVAWFEHRPASTVWVIGDRCVGDVDPVLAQQARRLAAKANVRLLGVYFSEGGPHAEFLDATLHADVDCSDVTDAVLHYILATDLPDLSN